MPTPFLSGRVPQYIIDRIDERAKETGETRTQIMIKALCLYLDVSPSVDNSGITIDGEPLSDVITMITARLNCLEESAKELPF